MAADRLRCKEFLKSGTPAAFPVARSTVSAVNFAFHAEARRSAEGAENIVSAPSGGLLFR
jgi:hypothetical protein